jgi:hypothetical protein
LPLSGFGDSPKQAITLARSIKFALAGAQLLRTGACRYEQKLRSGGLEYHDLWLFPGWHITCEGNRSKHAVALTCASVVHTTKTAA